MSSRTRIGDSVFWSKRNPLQLIIAVAILVRVAAALYLGEIVEALPGTHDQISYDALAQNVAAGKGFVFDEYWYPFTPPDTPTAHWSFLYTIYLAANLSALSDIIRWSPGWSRRLLSVC